MSDRRVLRTKRALRSALLEVIVERGYDAVSVQAIADRADVGRATFYTHYADKEDLLLGSLDPLAARLRRGAPSAKSRFVLFQSIPVLRTRFRGTAFSFGGRELTPRLAYSARDCFGHSRHKFPCDSSMVGHRSSCAEHPRNPRPLSGPQPPTSRYPQRDGMALLFFPGALAMSGLHSDARRSPSSGRLSSSTRGMTPAYSSP